MASFLVPTLPVSQAGRTLHDLGLAGMLGGNLFGRHALHPSVTEISDPAERGKLVNAAWRRYGTAEVGLVAVNAALTRRNFRRPALRRLVMLRD